MAKASTNKQVVKQAAKKPAAKTPAKPTPVQPEVTASMILSDAHPLHRVFIAKCKKLGVEPTKRQARFFLRNNPNFRNARVAQ